ncbi:MAG: SDR family oxidoreductase [Planctomycetaceae bacterium]|nr:SDR family oxidoreductase [Planctomycetaceae bacterium]
MKRQVIVVTGAAAGVGRAVVRAFAKPGRAIALLARDTEGLRNARREVEERGAAVLAIPLDIADSTQVEQAAERIENELGPIDIWVNDAMTTIFARFVDITPEEYRRATEVTYLGTVYGTMAALKRMYPRNRGTIVQVGSALSYRAIPLQSPYCGAKFAIRGFTDSIRSELIHDRRNIHITMVHLPAVNTPQFSWCRTRLPRHPEPVPPIYQPEVVARAIVHAAYHHRREWHVGLSTLLAIYGNKLLPGLLDRYLAGRRAWEGQETSQPVPAHRPDNLFRPLPGDFGAHGVFDNRSRTSSIAWWLSAHRGKILTGVATLAGTIAGVALKRTLTGTARDSLPKLTAVASNDHVADD